MWNHNSRIQGLKFDVGGQETGHIGEHWSSSAKAAWSKTRKHRGCRWTPKTTFWWIPCLQALAFLLARPSSDRMRHPVIADSKLLYSKLKSISQLYTTLERNIARSDSTSGLIGADKSTSKIVWTIYLWKVSWKKGEINIRNEGHH